MRKNVFAGMYPNKNSLKNIFYPPILERNSFDRNVRATMAFQSHT